MDDLQILKRSQQEKKETATSKCTRKLDVSNDVDDEEARDNFLKDVYTFLRKFSRIPFGVTPKVILIAWESFGKIKDALMDKQYQQEDIQELMSKLLEDVRNISEEFSEYINCPSWNRSLFYFDDNDDEYTVIWRRPKAITPDEPSKEPKDPLIMGEEELSTIPEKDKSSVEDLVLIPSGSKGVSNDICDNDHSDAKSFLSQDITITSPKIDFLSEEFAGELAPIPPGMDKDEFDEEEDDYVILCEKLLNAKCLIANIESLNDNPTPDRVLKSPSSSPIPVTDSDSFFEKSDTSFSQLGNSLPEFETFRDHTEETRSGSTTSHAINSLPEYDSFHFEIEPVQDGLTSVVMEDILGEPRVHVPNVLPTHPTLMMDSDVIIRTFLPYFTYPMESSFPLSTGSEDTIFYPGTEYQEKDKNKDKTEQIRARDRKERRKRISTVPSDFIGPARNPLNGPGQPNQVKAQQRNK
ncbi:hypothetical protein Tco_1378692 [Tanacetum coccineum]